MSAEGGRADAPWQVAQRIFAKLGLPDDFRKRDPISLLLADWRDRCVAAQPSESEREGARDHCLSCWADGCRGVPVAPPSPPSTGQPECERLRLGLCCNEHVPCCLCAGVIGRAPSTGQSREQRLEEALRDLYALHLCDGDGGCLICATFRRALESKP